MILNKNIKFIGITSLLLLSTTACKKEGCMDVLATNYNEEAKKDDGSCIYPTFEVPTTYAFTDASGNNISTISYTTKDKNLVPRFKTRYNQLLFLRKQPCITTGTCSTLLLIK